MRVCPRRSENPSCSAAPSLLSQAWAAEDERLHARMRTHVPEALEHNGEESFANHLVGVQVWIVVPAVRSVTTWTHRAAAFT